MLSNKNNRYFSEHSEVNSKNHNSQKVIIKNYAYLFHTVTPFILLIFMIGLLAIWKYLKIIILVLGEVSITYFMFNLNISTIRKK